MNRCTGFILTTLLALASLILTSCGSGPGTQGASPASAAEVQLASSEQSRQAAPQVDQATIDAVVAGNTAFAIDLYQQLRTQEGNLFYSPYSISAALAMAYAGTRAETAQQMATTLHFPEPTEQIHPAFNALSLNLVPPDTSAEPDPQAAAEGEPAFRLTIANSLWGQQDHPFEPAFLDLIAQHYGAGMRLVNFADAPEPSREAINGWVSDQTQEQIQDLVPPGAIDSMTRLVLANAIYFKAKWLHPFVAESTSDEPFSLLDSSTVTVPMMHQTERFLYATEKGYQAVGLPYDGNAEMVILLPDAGTFQNFEANLSGAQVQDIVTRLAFRRVNLTMPKFSFADGENLKETLIAMGMRAAFDANQADFSGMDGTRDLYISDVFHKAFVAVDEAGTEASAATAVVIAERSALIDPQEPVTVTIDRPFLFLIRDTTTGTILFTGRVVDPTL